MDVSLLINLSCSSRKINLYCNVICLLKTVACEVAIGSLEHILDFSIKFIFPLACKLD